ncbi:MAG: 3-hydroxybutyrate dehydrogenase [Holosporales bacterium]
MLKGKSAVITGSTSGIGLGIAEVLAQQGANIILNGFGEPDQIKATQKQLEGYGVQTHYIAADLMKPEENQRLIDEAAQHFGSVDILVNNAGIQHVAKVEDFPLEKWQQILDLNLSAAFWAMQRALPLMRQQNWGRIINIASAHGLVASSEKAAYVAAKHGLVGLTKVVALETAESGITCNAICPGWVLTPLVEKQIEARMTSQNLSREAATRDLLAEKQPTLRFVRPEDIGGLVAFLCSPAADTMTGTALPVDGAWTAR